MAKFTDQAGNDWVFDFTTRELGRIKSESGINPLSLFDDQLKKVVELSEDVVQLGLFVWCCCAPQATRNGVTPEAFDQAVKADELEAAMWAILESCCEFMGAKKKATFQPMLAKLKEVNRLTAEGAQKKAIDAIASLDANKMAKDILNFAGNSAESPA